MATYTLRFDHLDNNTRLRPLAITGETTADLAQAVHRHARGRLGSRAVDIHLDPNSLTGSVLRNGVTAGKFTLTPAETADPDPAPNTDGIRYGWTLARLDLLARSVVSNNRAWWPAGDRDDLYAAAWHGIVEHLYTATSEPGRGELMEAGRRALTSDVKNTMRHHGARRDGTNTGQKHAMYWDWHNRHTPSPETTIVDRIALYQILPTLTPGQRQALEVLAATGDYQQAGQLLGGSQSGLKSQLMKGRRRFRELWHEGETPSTPWGVDRRAGKRAGEITGGDTALNRLRRRRRTQQQASDAT